MTHAEQQPAETAPGARTATPLHRNPWLWAFLIGVTLVSLIRPLLRRVPDPPPVLALLPPFELIEAGGKRFGRAELEGSTWNLTFFSATGGSAICRGLIDSMADLGQRYDRAGVPEVRLLGISSEPSRETSARLREFGEARGFTPPRWTLATGEPEEARRLAEFLFEATGGQPVPGGPPGSVPHPCKLFLIDGSGGVRGSYRDDTKGLDEIFHRSQHVVREMRREPPARVP